MVWFAGTVTSIPAPVKSSAVPVVAAPEQSDVVKTLISTGEPPPTVPFTSGFALCEGEVGVVPPIVGASGAIESWV